MGGKVPAVGWKVPAVGLKVPAEGGKVPAAGGKVPAEGWKVPAEGWKVPAAAVAADDVGQVTFKGKETCSSGCIAENGGARFAPSHADGEK